VNCSGPWVEQIGPTLHNKHLFSRGAHLLFNREWTGPALFLPMPGKARYYFVWPHRGGTMVGTTESETKNVELDPLPICGEVEEILARLSKDMPNSGLSRESLYYAFVGIRSLPQRGTKGTARVSRRHIWEQRGKVVSLFGGKYTTAAATAREGLRIVMSVLGKSYSDPSVGLPTERTSELMKATHFSQDNLIDLAKVHVKYSQAVNLEDLMRLRLGLEYLPGHGLDRLEEVAETLTWRSTNERTAATFDYRERVSKIRKILSLN
jgi:glycerol-3-phosphate dehydrogenase